MLEFRNLDYRLAAAIWRMGPSSVSIKLAGNSRAVSALIPAGFRPSAFATTGSKSTNHDLKIVRAMASSV